MKVRFLHLSRISISALFFFIAFFLYQNSIYADANRLDNTHLAQEITLIEAIHHISEQYQVLFNYDRNIVSDITVEYEPKEFENVDAAIASILKETNLKYQIFSQRYVVIYKNDEERIESLKEMIQHFQTIVDDREDIVLERQRLRPSPKLIRTLSQDVLGDRTLSFSIEGTVTDQDGEPLIGVNIQVKGTNMGTSTDIDGKFAIDDIDENAVLVVSYIGYQTQEVSVAGKSNLSIVLLSDSQLLDEVVVVGYGQQKKTSLTGSVASVKAEKLTVTPVGNITNTLTGKLPGLITKQTSGLPGGDAAMMSIRGFGSALVIVDGVESNLNNLDPNQIESISILKDGAASIYGARAGNGVILVTTKRGIIQKPTITFNTSYTMQGVTNRLETLNSGQWTQLRRESHLNSGKPNETAPYTAEEVRKYYAGDDPAYPSSDWYNFVFRDWAPQQNYNVSIRGGSEKIRYMGFIGYQKQETMIKRNGGEYDRFNFTTNLDADITDDLLLNISLMGAYEQTLYPGRGLGNGPGIVWQDLYATRPMFPTTLPDPTKNASGGADVGSVALSSNMDIWGYNRNKPKDLRGTVTFTYDMPFIEGLNAKALVNYIDWSQIGKRFQKPYEWYTYNHEADVYTHAGSLWSAAQSNEWTDISRNITQQYSLNYDHTFNDHHLTALALFESVDYFAHNFSAARREFLTPAIEQLFAGSASTQTNNGSASESGRVSYVGRINYSYKDKYLFEAILRADATSKFNEDQRWGYFPAVSLGWVVSQESFMENLSALEFFKFRASYGASGFDNVANFAYVTGYNVSGVYQWGNSFTSGLTSSGLPNPLLTWEEMEIYNGGLDFSILDRSLYGSLDVFYRTRTGIPGRRVDSYPSTFGADLPVENLNSLNNRGFELSLGTEKNRGNFTYDISGNISWSRAKWDMFDEPEYDDPDQKRQNQLSGQWTDRVFGYISDGLFESMQEIEALPFTYSDLGGNHSLRPGDVKFKDINGDGELNWRDKVELGNGDIPHWIYGLNGTFMYKNFDLVTMFQGAFGYSASVAHVYQTKYSFENRWTEDNPDRFYPRPGGAGSNGWTSDYWHKKSQYLRLKNAAIGYTLPKQLVNKVNFQKLRFYVSGSNLFTWSNMTKYGIDPELQSGTAGRYYPQMRTISFGLNLDF